MAFCVKRQDDFTVHTQQQSRRIVGRISKRAEHGCCWVGNWIYAKKRNVKFWRFCCNFDHFSGEPTAGMRRDCVATWPNVVIVCNQSSTVILLFLIKRRVASIEFPSQIRLIAPLVCHAKPIYRVYFWSERIFVRVQAASPDDNIERVCLWAGEWVNPFLLQFSPYIILIREMRIIKMSND